MLKPSQEIPEDFSPPTTGGLWSLKDVTLGFALGVASTIGAVVATPPVVRMLQSDRVHLMDESTQLAAEQHSLALEVTSLMRFKNTSLTDEQSFALDRAWKNLRDRVIAHNERVDVYNADLIKKKPSAALGRSSVDPQPRSLGHLDLNAMDSEFGKPRYFDEKGQMHDVEFDVLTPDEKSKAEFR